MGRIPEEPTFEAANEGTAPIAGEEGPKGGESKERRFGAAAISWTVGLDFVELEKSTSSKDERDAACREHMAKLVEDALRLSDPDRTPMESSTHRTGKSGVVVRVDKSPVLGVRVPDLECVRHAADFDLDARTLLDVWVRLFCTDAVDAYAYRVERLDTVDCAASGRFKWAHVARTADDILPFLAHRDFVALNFVDEGALTLACRSCAHPSRPPTRFPTCLDSLLGPFTKRPSRTVRAPLFWFVRAVPLGEDKCRLVQFQFADVGGIVPPAEQTKAAVKFGLRNMDRVYRLAKRAREKGLDVGPNATDYLADPILS
ncbi:hypothetical protein ACHAWF_013788, partial [Thalassiosira exigua]